jgi:hypothetical protein
MNGHSMTLARLLQRLDKELAVFFIGEDRFAIIPTQDDMQRDIFDEIAGEAGHE